MSATLQLMRMTARIDNLVWTSQNPELERLLNALVPRDADGPHIANPDYFEAVRVAEVLGGRVILHDEASGDPDLVY